MKLSLLLLVAVGGVVSSLPPVAVTGLAAGPASELFLTPAQNRLVGVSGASVQLNVGQAAGGGQSPLAINNTVRALPFNFNNSGAEYTLAGAPTGNTYAFPGALGTESLLDGATDGSFNYAWGFGQGVLYQFSLNWTNPIVIFSLGNGSGSRLGLTYDPSNDSFWIAGFASTVGTLISDYSRNGTLLSSFNIGHDQNGALALDPADGTLWLTNTTASTLTLEQYLRSTPGSFGATQTPLNTQSYAGISATTYGGEFQFVGVPEPSIGVLLLAAIATFALHRSLRRKNSFPG